MRKRPFPRRGERADCPLEAPGAGLEGLDVRKPFNVAGTNWEVTNLTADGKFEFVKKPRPD